MGCFMFVAVGRRYKDTKHYYKNTRAYIIINLVIVISGISPETLSRVTTYKIVLTKFKFHV
jgi:hypothetical protein